MTIDLNDEILQDFLVEAGEILEQLNQQLVELEQQPDDYDLLNAVFRGFHTIKGGAGFLNIAALVEICHRAEDVFNLLRQGKRQVDARLMDIVLRVLDVLNEMFQRVQSGDEPAPADLELLDALALQQLNEPVEQDSEGRDVVTAKVDPETDGSASATEGLVGIESNPIPQEDEEITEAEFEALLDELHGSGKFGGVPVPGTDENGSSSAAEAQGVVSQDEDSRQVAVSNRIPEQQVPSAGAVKGVAAKNESGKKRSSTAETTVRVDTARLDDIMNMVGELVLVRNRLATLKARLGDEEVANAVANLDVVTSDLQNSVMKTRMQPVKKVFGRFPRVVRDLARSLGKEIDLEMFGEDTDLDKNLVEALADPMVHLVRNAVDHGIEQSDQRERVGKSRRGKVILSAAQEGDHILLSIADDGKGMDADVLRRKAVEKGMMDEVLAARLTEKECYNLIFHPGFSTKTEVSDVSGRGVGMDVVKTRIAQMNGTVEIDSESGKGSKIIIKLPLTLAILPTLMVVLGEQPFALPLASVVEIFNLDLERSNVVDGQLTLMVRERALPLFYLRSWLVHPDRQRDIETTGHVVIVNAGGRQVGMVVDYLIGQEEVVIKPLGALLQGLDGMAGATITGDGNIALILDVPGLIRKYAHRH